ncbi:MAG: hypothetical protein J1E01_05495 [Acetatifactor sp.]|nr:hypothetical protein [Acetatifactor sp.]
MKLITLLFLLLTGCILTNSAQSLVYAGLGLELWFSKMIPALLPFMILSGIMVRLNLTERMSMAVYPMVGPLYKVRKNVCYCMLLGFLCGFPMGAKVTGELRERGMLTQREAQYLLAFCNNIGPVYFCSFVLPLLGRRLVLPYLFGMYGIPLLYGLILRYTVYSDIGITSTRQPALSPVGKQHYDRHMQSTVGKLTAGRHMQSTVGKLTAGRRMQSTAGKLTDGKRTQVELKSCELPPKKKATWLLILEAAEQSVQASIQSILMLGGYMILFNLMNLVPHVLLGRPLTVMGPLLEITGGLGMLQQSLPLYSLLALSFGGLSCIAQTYSCIRNTDLSLSGYIFHKVLLTLLNAGFYLCWFLFWPGSFLR